MRNVFFLVVILAAVLGIYFYNKEEPMPQVKLTTTYGDIVLELDKENAPISTENFISYVESGFYNETIFHRFWASV